MTQPAPATAVITMATAPKTILPFIITPSTLLVTPTITHPHPVQQVGV